MPFRDIRGQELAASALRGAVRKGAVSHAYLFVGPNHVGKTAMAQVFAKLLKCEEPIQEPLDPCDRCEMCRRVDLESHPDVSSLRPMLEADSPFRVAPEHLPDSVIPIGLVRALENRSHLRSLTGGYRMYIVQEADKMQEEAQNALLKTLEEPASNVVLILVTSRPASLLPTISSRCQVVRFHRLPEREIESLLRDHFNLSREERGWLARLAQGRPGWAVGAAEKHRATASGLEGRRDVLALLESTIRGDRVEAFRLGEEALALAERWAHAETESLGLENDWGRVRLRLVRSKSVELLDHLAFLTRDLMMAGRGDWERFVIDRDALEEISRLRAHTADVRWGRALAEVWRTTRCVAGNANLSLAWETLFLRLMTLWQGTREDGTLNVSVGSADGSAGSRCLGREMKR